MKFYIIEKFYDRFGTILSTRGAVHAEKIEDITFPADETKFGMWVNFADENEEKVLPISQRRTFNADGDFHKLSDTQAYVEHEEGILGIGATKEEAWSALAKAEFKDIGDAGDWE